MAKALMVDTHWLYCLCTAPLGALCWRPVALRDRHTGKVYILIPVLTQAEAECGYGDKGA